MDYVWVKLWTFWCPNVFICFAVCCQNVKLSMCSYFCSEAGFSILNEIGVDGGNKFGELENVTKESSSLSEEHSEWVLDRSDNAKIINGNISSSKQVVVPASSNNTPRYTPSTVVCIYKLAALIFLLGPVTKFQMSDNLQ